MKMCCCMCIRERGCFSRYNDAATLLAQGWTAASCCILCRFSCLWFDPGEQAPVWCCCIASICGYRLSVISPIYALHWCIHPCQETPCTYLHTQNNGVSHLVLITSCSGSVRSLAFSDLIWHLHTILLVLLHGAATEGHAVLHATLAADWPLLLGCYCIQPALCAAIRCRRDGSQLSSICTASARHRLWGCSAACHHHP